MRTILHIDMDAFYASIEQRDQPSYKGQPVIVGSPPTQRGVVSAASYEARKYGIHSAMPSRLAAKKCPHAIFLPVDMNKYVAVSEQLHIILETYTPFIEPLALDEAFLDISGIMHQWPSPAAIAQALKNHIRDTLHLPCSIGIGPNKFLAKLASDLRKPDGFCETPRDPKAIKAFLAPLPVGRIWGVGKVAKKRLERHGIVNIGDLQKLNIQQVQGIAGSRKIAEQWSKLASGIDSRKIQMDVQEKSISREHTFTEDCHNMAIIHQRLLELTEDVGFQLRKAGLKASTIYIKYRYQDFRTFTRQQKLPALTSHDRDLWQIAQTILNAQHIEQPIRLIGFGVFPHQINDKNNAQMNLFESAHQSSEAVTKEDRLDRTVDRLRGEYGTRAIRRGNWKLSKEES